MVDEIHIFHFRLSTYDRCYTARFAALEHDVHRVAIIIECEDTRCIVVSCVLAKPRRILRIAIQHRHIRHYAAVNHLDAGFLHSFHPLVEKSGLALPT